VQFADLNNDGVLDIVSSSGNKIVTALGNGNGTFGASRSTDTGAAVSSLITGDFNNDGFTDVAAANGNIAILFGSGNGTLSNRATFAQPGGLGSQIAAGDLNNDGITDLICYSSYAGQMTPFLGNRDGTFKAGTTLIESGDSMWVGDIDRDGVLDVVVSAYAFSSITINKGQAVKSSTSQYYNINTQAGARSAMDIVESVFQRVEKEISNIGASQSRLASALGALGSARDNSLAAAGRITDADIAQASSDLVRTTILQKSAAAVLANANQLPQLALRLLSG
jgi:flagellin